MEALWGVGAPLSAAVGGVMAWTLVEYVLHRWVFHPRGDAPDSVGRKAVRALTAGEHLRHHRQPLRTSPVLRCLAWTGTIAAGAAFAVALDSALGGGVGSAGIAGAAGWGLGFTCYELAHWRSHHVDVDNGWERRLRHRHFAHHFGDPQRNFGVTVTWWDRVFGTLATSGDVVVPRRHAPKWLVEQAASDDARITSCTGLVLRGGERRS